MNTSDLTLLGFLSDRKIGAAKSVSSDILAELGHTEETASEIEFLTFQLNKEFEVGELPSLAVDYLMRLGFTDLSIKQSEFEKDVLPEGFETENCFDHICLIIAKNNKDGMKSIIQVHYTSTICVFAKHDSLD
jgi:hypothetical protein